jgi:hypothetical protein
MSEFCDDFYIQREGGKAKLSLDLGSNNEEDAETSN